MRHFVFLIAIGFAICPGISGQFQSQYFQSEELTEDSGKYSVFINASGFFHNNEYFSTDEEGYTLTGSYLNPVFNIKFNDKFSMGTGIFLLKYNGLRRISDISPYFNLKYRFTEGGNILLGSYYGGDNLHLPEPLYARENHFRSQILNGIRADYSLAGLKLMLWLDWEKFIEENDPFREEFSAGLNASYKIELPGENYLEIPVYFLVNHKGGQINDSNLPVETISDYSTGLIANKKSDFLIFNDLKMSGLTFIERDSHDDSDGYSILGQVEAIGEFVSLAGGYFFARNWESINGNPLLFCGDDNSAHKKSMILVKAGFGKKLSTGSSFSLRFEGYYDMRIKKFQYQYGIYLNVNELIAGFGK